MAADDLAMQGSRESATMILTWLKQDMVKDNMCNMYSWVS